MFERLLLIFIIGLACVEAHAARVLKVDKNQTLMAVSHTQVRRWRLGDYLCVLHDDEEVACGAAIRITSRGAIVRFDYRTGKPIKPGDEVQFYAAAEEAEQGTKMPEAPEPEPSGPPAPVEDPALSPSAIAEKKSDLKKPKEVVPTPAPEETKRPAAKAPKAETGEEEWVDLDSLDEQVVVPAPEAPKGPHGAMRPSSKPRIKVMYDWLLTYRPGFSPSWTFDNYHNLLMLEYTPSRDIYFGFEVSPNPRFFELDYELSNRLTFRIGRIYVPFDDLSPHSYFGGRANINRLVPGDGTSFLPDIWTDMGMGLHWAAYRGKTYSLDAHFYVTNGFGEGPGLNPITPSGLYPDFQNAIGVQDNNRDKAIGLRVAGNFLGDMLGFGISAFRCRYSNEENPAGYINMLGADAQFRKGGFEARAGYVFMLVDLPYMTPANYRRGGVYAEVSQTLGRKNQFKALLRGGAVNHDSRALLPTDQIIFGGQMVYRFGAVAVGVEHSKDLNELTGKPDNSFTGLRVTVGI